MSTQREQLWAVGKAARGEGATLQALAAIVHSSIQSKAASPSQPDQRRQLAGGSPFWILNLSTAGSKLDPGYALQIIMHPKHPHPRSNWRGGGPILSTQREQLWAVDTAAGGEGATLQALAATRRPTQRGHL